MQDKNIGSMTVNTSGKTKNEPLNFTDESFKSHVTKIGTVCVYECDWGKDEYALYHDGETDNYFIYSESGFCLKDCPSDINEIDTDLVNEAVVCFYNLYSTYGFMSFSYDGLEGQIRNAYQSVHC